MISVTILLQRVKTAVRFCEFALTMLGLATGRASGL